MLEATLSETIITGAVTKTYAKLASGEEIKSTQLTSGPLAGDMRGKEIRLGWPAERTVVLEPGERALS